MSEILSYFGEIIVITAISGILFTVAPEGNVKKYIHLHFGGDRGADDFRGVKASGKNPA